MDGNRYLLDTHSLIWFPENNPRFPRKAMSIAEDGNNTILFSQVSLFEIATKQKVGKSLGMSVSAEEFYHQAINSGLIFLSIQNEHIYNYNQIPSVENHRDPFDRLLIATANHEKATIITGDEKFALYGDFVKVLW